MNKREVPVETELHTEEVLIRDREYEMECLWLDAIEKGALRAGIHNNRSGLIRDLDQDAKDISFTRVQFALVGGITLACRAAIRGGVSTTAANDLTRDLLMKVERCETIPELVQAAGDFDLCFSGLVAENKKAGKSNVEIYREYMNDHLFRKFSVQQMADDLNVHRSHMTRTFAKATGMSVAEYMRSERLKMAAIMLEKTDNPVAIIAETLHFTSQSQFGAYFKQRYKITPSEFRKRVTKYE